MRTINQRWNSPCEELFNRHSHPHTSDVDTQKSLLDTQYVPALKITECEGYVEQ